MDYVKANPHTTAACSCRIVQLNFSKGRFNKSNIIAASLFQMAAALMVSGNSLKDGSSGIMLRIHFRPFIMTLWMLWDGML
jgi:predicted naringenin-chalcone synthase